MTTKSPGPGARLHSSLAAMPPVAPITVASPDEKLDARAFRLYVDDAHVPCTSVDLYCDEKNPAVLVVVFRTSINALDDGGSDPRLDVAWGGYRPGMRVSLVQQAAAEGRRLPSPGTVDVESIEAPLERGGETYFICRAVTPVVDWNNEEQVASAGDRLKVPAGWFPLRGDA